MSGFCNAILCVSNDGGDVVDYRQFTPDCYTEPEITYQEPEIEFDSELAKRNHARMRASYRYWTNTEYTEWETVLKEESEIERIEMVYEQPHSWDDIKYLSYKCH